MWIPGQKKFDNPRLNKMVLDYQCVTSMPVAPSRHPVSRPAIPVLAVTRCSEYEKKVSLWVKKKMDNDLYDNTE